MQNIDLPKKVDFCKSMHIKPPCLILTGPTTLNVAGKKVSKELEKNDYLVNMEIVKDINRKSLTNLIEKAKTFNFLIGVGGGRIIDAAKFVSSRAYLPFISVPTIPSHDGIASPRATIRIEDNIHSFEAVPPIAIFADLNILSKAPKKFVASGCADVISNITAVADWKLSQQMNGTKVLDYAADLALSAANSIIENADKIYENPDVLMDALINSGIAMCFTKDSRPASGADHMFSHTLDRICPKKKTTHGEQCGVGCLIMAYLHGMDVEEIRTALKQVGAPVTAKEMEIEPDILVKAFAEAKNLRKDRYTILNQVNIDESKAREILKALNII